MSMSAVTELENLLKLQLLFLYLIINEFIGRQSVLYDNRKENLQGISLSHQKFDKFCCLSFFSNDQDVCNIALKLFS